MPTVIATQDIKDTAHWLPSPKRAEIFTTIGVTHIRTFVNPQNRNNVGLIMDVPDMEAMMALLESDDGKARLRRSTTGFLLRPSRSTSRSRPRGPAGGTIRGGAR